MEHLITLIVCGPLTIGMVFWAILLMLGKGYRSIAGNSSAPDEIVQQQRDTKLGSGMAVLLLVIAVVPGVLCIYSIAHLI